MAYQVSFPSPGIRKAWNQTAALSGQICPVSGESRCEEVVNCLTHAFGLALSVAGLVFLLTLAITYGDQWHVIGCGIYSVTLVLAYGASTLYHGLGPRRGKSCCDKWTRPSSTCSSLVPIPRLLWSHFMESGDGPCSP
ncbi:MAG TPA: hemolysin III family protein [Dehalococcoidia bacterium]|nr:hemolysin III family protein [Dehalococcoidia bacterium]